MSSINTSGINPAWPVYGNPQTANVRANFAEIIVQLNNAASDIDNLQPIDAVLSGYSGVTIAADQIHYATGTNVMDVTTLTPWARANLLASTGDITVDNLTVSNNFTVDGNLSIGNATFESHATNVKAIEVGGNGVISANATPSGAGWIDLMQNAYQAVGQYQYQDAGLATRYQQYNGSHIFSVAASGGADAAISWTTALTINNDATSNFGSGIYVPDTAFVGFGDFNTRITGSSSADTLDFYTNAALAVTIDSGGNVGIGTSTPTTYGSGAQFISYTAGGGGGGILHDNATGTFPKVSAFSLGSNAVSLTHTSNGGTYTLFGSAQIIAEQHASSGAPTDLVFYTTQGGSVLEAMRIDTAQNVGIAAAPINDFTTAASAMQIGQSAVFTGKTTGTGGWVDIMQNTYYSVTGFQHRYIVDGEVSKYTVGYGGHYWYVAPTGFAGNTLTLTTAMQINTHATGYAVVVNPSSYGTNPQLQIYNNSFGWHVTSGSVLTHSSGGQQKFLSQGQSTLTLDNQKVGIGQTIPNTNWGNNYDVVDMDDGGLFSYVSVWLGQNVYHNNTNFLYKTAGAASFIQLSSSGNISFHVADSGAADGVASFTEIAKFDNTGAFMLKEKAAAATPSQGGYGEIWVKTATPNELWFTDDDGTDYQLNTGVTSYWTQTGNDIYYSTGVISVGKSTFESWDGTYDVIQFGAFGALLSHASAGGAQETILTHNSYYNAGWKYTEGDYVWHIELDGPDVIFRGATSGSPDAAISFTEILRINYDEQSVSLNKTATENWDATITAFEVGGNAALSASITAGAGNRVDLTQNAYFDNIGWKYQDEDEASRYTQANGVHTFRVAGSAAADTGITWTVATTINNDGSMTTDGITLASNSLTPTSALAVGLSPVLANGDYSIAMGYNAVAQETNCISIGRQTTTGQTSGASVEQRAIALGYNTRAYETDCISIGYNAVSGKSGTSVDPQAVAIGPSSLADAGSSTAIGNSANSRAFGSTAIGYLADAREFECIAIGDAQAGQTADASTEQAAIAIGPNCFAYETRGIAIGDGAITGQNGTSLDPNSIAIGYLALADQEDAVAIGRGSDARATSCVGIGDSAQALETSSVAIGINAQTGQSAGGSSYTSGVAIGPNAKGFDVACVAIGSLANAGITATSGNPYAVAIGYSSESFGSGTVAVGANTDAKADGAVAVGQGAFARELNTIAIGDTSQAGQTNDASTEQTAIAIGSSTKAYETGCVALGGSAIAGKNGTSLDPYAVAVGYAALATADYGVAIGPNAESRGSDSVALGRLADARETHSIAIGSNSRAGTTDEGTGAIDGIAIGYAAVADLDGSIAIGSGATVATANVAVIGGNNKQINDLYIGKGETNGTPIDVGIHPTSALGTDIAGGNLEIAGGRSTGTGVGGSILFQTSEAGGTGTTLNSLTERMSIDQKGNVAIGTAALGTTATDGFLYIPTCAGAPTGTPTTKTGRVALIFDTTNNNLYVYDGSWISVALA